MRPIAIKTEDCLSLLIWNTCNARCAHCGPMSGPKDKTGITHEKTLDLIREAGHLYHRGWCLSLSGGEIFLHYDRLLEYASLAQSLGGYTTLITNGYWATSVAVAEEKLRPLKAADLRLLGLSADRFHEPYIPLQRIKNAITAANEIGIPVQLRSVASRSGRLSDVLKGIEDAHPWFVQFMEMPLIPDGRARDIDESELFLKDEIPGGACPAASLTLNPSGDAMVCCNGGGSYEPLQLGNIRNYSLRDLEYRFATDPTLLFLRNVGPKAVLEHLPKHERERLESKRYVNECHLCLEIFSGKYGGSAKRSIERDFLSTMASTISDGGLRSADQGVLKIGRTKKPVEV